MKQFTKSDLDQITFTNTINEIAMKINTARTPVKSIAEHTELCAAQIANEQFSNILANIAKCKTRKGMNAIIATI